MSRRSAARERYWGMPVPAHLAHGPKTWACHVYGCGCQVCLPSGRRTWRNTEDATGPLSHRDRQKKYQARLKGRPVPEGKHGERGYRLYGCRCDICKAERRAKDLRQRNAWRNRARGRYSEGKDGDGQATTVICWPPRDAPPDWTCPDPSHLEI